MSVPEFWGDFLILPENRSAVQAVQSIAKTLLAGRRTTLIPLVLHGPPGTGKTHLTSALLRRLSDGPAVVTAQAVAAGDLARGAAVDDDLPGFTDRDFLTCDLLILEDVQLLPTREADAVCNLLDRRASRLRPAIVTANTGPASLRHLPQRLTSRLASGLVLQMEPFAPASRRVLLEVAADDRNVPLTPDALDWLIAQSAGGGVRTLLGVLNNLALVSRAFPGPLDRHTVKGILTESGQPTSTERDIGGIVKHVAAAFGVSKKDLLGTSRLRKVMVPRQVAMYLARELCGLSLPRIGAAFGGRDHTTVLHSCRKVEADIETDQCLAGVIRQLRAELG